MKYLSSLILACLMSGVSTSAKTDVRIESEPHVKLYLDGEPIGESGAEGRVIVLEGLAPGEYKLRGEKEGYVSQASDLRVRSGKGAKVYVQLEPFVLPVVESQFGEHPSVARIEALKREFDHVERLLLDPPAEWGTADMWEAWERKSELTQRITDEENLLSRALTPQLEQRFNKEYAAYRLIIEADGVGDAAKRLAWRGICENWRIQSGETPGYLIWNRASEAPELVHCGVPVTGKAVLVDLGNNVTMKLVPIARGTFHMGRDNENGEESPVHRVTLAKHFWIGETEVTQHQYQQLMAVNPSKFRAPQGPVETVSWDDAVEFCARLTKQEQVAGNLPVGYSYQLPTEAQWEYVARAGAASTQSPDDLARVAWYYGNAEQKTHTVATKEPNAWGLYDIYGNVYEWCSDWYGNYNHGSLTDPSGAYVGSEKVIRGGSWATYSNKCHPTKRLKLSPGKKEPILGFRIVLTPPRGGAR